MQINTMAGWCLIVLGVVQILHEIVERGRGNFPGVAYTVVTALFFTMGFVFLWKKPIRLRSATPKGKGPSILQD